MHFTLLDWVVLIAYFIGTMGIGVYFYRRTRSVEGYTAANRSMPGWVCGLSIFATFLSSISYLALPGKSFVSNWNPFVFSLAIPLVAVVAVYYFLPYYRNSGEVSAYAALEKRFGLWARIYASCLYLLTQIARIAVVMYLMALPMQVIFGWNIYLVLLATGVCVTLYSFVGGILAVIWTDAIQAIVLMVGALLCLVVLLFTMPGGMERLADVGDKFSLGELGASVNEGIVSFDFAGPTIIVVFLYSIVENLKNFGVDQSYIQRYIAAGTDADARRSVWLGALLYVPVSAVFFFIGTTLYVYYDAAPATGASVQQQDSTDLSEVKTIVAKQQLSEAGVDPAGADYESQLAERASKLELKDIGDRVFPHFISKHLPPGITGLLVAAVFAAGMSTISTSLNSSATLVMNDLYGRLWRPDANEHESMLVLYAATIAWGVLGTGLAVILVTVTDSALEMWWTLAGVLGGGLTGLFLLGFLSRRTGNVGAITGVTVGIVALIWLSVPKIASFALKWPAEHTIHKWGDSLQQSSETYLSPFHVYMAPVFGTLLILVVGVSVSRIWRWINDRKSPTTPANTNS